MDKKIRIVYGVNPMTAEPCTYRLVVSDDVTLWWADGELDEAAFNQLDSDEVGMICFSHASCSALITAYFHVITETVARAQPPWRRLEEKAAEA